MNRSISRLRSSKRRSRRISNLIAFIVLISAALIQTTLSPYMQINGIHPDLVVVLVIAWTILSDLEDGLTWALVGGLSLDLLSAAPFGIFTLALIMVAIVANFSHGRIFGSSIVLPLGFTFPLSILFNGIALLILSLLGRPVIWLDAFNDIFLPVAIFNTGVMVLVFPPLYYLYRRLHPQPLSF
ncbi:MAG: rod shape-determining protein MreD [Anaerolineales bacterium]|nr:rod shape-determining protein MreD [Anaerolineales bacterium]